MMTRTQKTTILEMRAEGITYKAIASQMGMSLGSVKMFVSRHNRADDRRCEQCGKLLPKGGWYRAAVLFHEMQKRVVEITPRQDGGRQATFLHMRHLRQNVHVL